MCRVADCARRSAGWSIRDVQQSVTRPAVSPAARPVSAPERHVAVVGLGYVGLPTSTALSAAGFGVIGLDASPRRLTEVGDRRVDLQAPERLQLSAALADPHFRLTGEPQALAEADAVLICVPTPVDAEY